MKLKRIELENFRLSEKETIDFADGVNLLCGKNAQGKTNVLEAIYFFARGKSFRGGKDTDLTRFGQKGFALSLTFTRGGEDKTLAYRYYDGARQRTVNGVKVGIKEFIGQFNAVFFCPDHLSIIKASPAVRREFLNIAITQLSAEYLNALTVHKKLCEHKNALFKSEEPYDRTFMQSLNEGLADACAKICLERRKYVEKLSASAFETQKQISGGREDVKIIYKCDVPAEFAGFDAVKQYYKDLFFENERREAAAKTCLFGIQRDDLEFLLCGKDAKQFASQGQQRSLALALKIGEGEIIAEERGEPPVYLFDDVLGELDEDRKRYVLSRTAGRQVIVTACERSDYLDLSDLTSIRVSNGHYEK